MSYIDYEYFSTLYGELSETDFNRLSWDASRAMDKATSGIDGVKKLRVAFPTDEDDAEAVRRCVADVVMLLDGISKAERNASLVGGLVESPDGTMRGAVVSSVSAGNESISYIVGKMQDSAISTAIKSAADKERVIYDAIVSKLRGISDANGVNLLFAGEYPYRLEVRDAEI